MERKNQPKFWVPLLALYHGCRINEICQLDTDDIIETGIDGATGSALKVTADLAGKFIKVVVTDLYSSSFEATTTTAVPIPLESISLNTEAPKINETLTALISPETATDVTYVWYSGDTSDKITTVIEKTTENTLNVTEALAGKFIKVVVTDSYDSSYEATTTTAVPVKLVSVLLDTETPKVSDTLTATISPDNAGGVTYAWYSGDTADSITTAIVGATGNTLDVTGDLTDKYIKVVATDLYSSSFSAATTSVVEMDESAGIVKAIIGNDVLESDDGENKLVLLNLYDANERPVNDLYIINSDYGIKIVFPEVGAEIVKIDNNTFISIDSRYYEYSDEPEIRIMLLMTEEEVCNYELEAPE